MMNVRLLHIATTRSGIMLFMPKAVRTKGEATYPIASQLFMVCSGTVCGTGSGLEILPSLASIHLQRTQYDLVLGPITAVVSNSNPDEGEKCDRRIERSHSSRPLRNNDPVCG